MNFDLLNPRRIISKGNKDENAIRDIFYQHWDKMKTQIKTMMDQIQEWRVKNILRIEDYAKIQMQRLEQDYNRQRDIFDKTRRSNLEKARIYSQSKSGEQIKELCDACKRLNFQVSQLNFVRYNCNYPVILTVEDLNRGRKINEIDNQIDEFGNCQDRTMLDDTSIKEKNDITNLKVYRQSSTLLNSMNGWCVINSSTHTMQRLLSNDSSSSNNSANKDYELISKCSVCFMIFPSYMTQDNRHEHINEHEFNYV